MVFHTKTEEKSKYSEIVVNTNSFRADDLNNYISLSQKIERNERKSKTKSRVAPPTLEATMTRREIFECSTLEEDNFLNALDSQSSHVAADSSTLSLSKSLENLLNYFNEDVSIDCKTTLKPRGSKVAEAIASLNAQAVGDAPVPLPRTKCLEPSSVPLPRAKSQDPSRVPLPRTKIPVPPRVPLTRVKSQEPSSVPLPRANSPESSSVSLPRSKSLQPSTNTNIKELKKKYEQPAKNLNSLDELRAPTPNKSSPEKLQHLMNIFEPPHHDNLHQLKEKYDSPVKKLKQKYELPKENFQEPVKKPNAATTKNLQFLEDNYVEDPAACLAPKLKNKYARRSKVKQIAKMFNDKVTQLMKRDNTYVPLNNELSPDVKIAPVKNPQPKLRCKPPTYRVGLPSPVPSPRQLRKQLLQKQYETTNTCLVAEDVFRQLSVKDKVLLYNKFIVDMSKSNPIFKLMQANVEKAVTSGQVISENQGKVKHMAEVLEAKCNSHKQTVSASALENVQVSDETLEPTTKTRTFELTQTTDAIEVPLKVVEHFEECTQTTEEEEEVMHYSTLTVVLKPSPVGKQRLIPPRVLPRKRREICFANSKPFDSIEPACKRSNQSIHSILSNEVYAPPKKIRRTRSERLAPKMFFQNEHMERLFYSWLKEKNGVSFDITSTENMKKTIEIKEEIPLDEETRKLSVDKLMQEAIAKLEVVEVQLKEALSTEHNELYESVTLTADCNLEGSSTLVERELSIEKDSSEEGADNNQQTAVKAPSRKKKHAPPIPTQNAEPQSTEPSTTSSDKHSEAEESDSPLSSTRKITTDESHPEENQHESFSGPTKNKIEESEFTAPLKPPRKKKMRRQLTWKKENSIVESKIISTTESDSDHKQAETDKTLIPAVPKPKKSTVSQLKKLFFKGHDGPMKKQDIQDTTTDLDKSLIRAVNSPTKIKSAYTLTVLSSPSPIVDSDYCETEQLRTSCREQSRSWPSLLTALQEEIASSQCKTASVEIKTDIKRKEHQQLKREERLLRDSFVDQGFETGSTADSPVRVLPRALSPSKRDLSPLLSKLKLELDSRRYSTNSPVGKPSGFSTPIRGFLQKAFNGTASPQNRTCSPIPLPAKPRRRSLYDMESRRGSLAMQVIREDHPLDHNDFVCSSGTPDSMKNNERIYFPNTQKKTDIANNALNLDAAASTTKISIFWVRAAEFTVSMEVFYNSPDRLRLLNNIFTKKNFEKCHLDFGIDDNKFSMHQPSDMEHISRRLPRANRLSHYWFSAGDLAVPFNGKYMPPCKVHRLFRFINSALTENENIRFGIDGLEFSGIPEFWQINPKYSIESSYNMLVGLQSGNSNGLEGRSKYAWPSSRNASVNSMRLDFSEYDPTYFQTDDLGRLSLSPFENSPINARNSEASSPEIFTQGYENEPLDHLFEKSTKTNSERKQTIPEMLETLREQQVKLKSAEERLRVYSDLRTSFLNDDIEQDKNSPNYMKKLRVIIAAIDNIGHGDGFKECSLQQLESFIFFLSRYANICLETCGDHIDNVLDALLKEQYTQV